MWEGPYSVIRWGYPWVQGCFNTQTNTHDKAARSLQTFRSSDLFLFDTYPFAALLRPSCPELPVLSFACLYIYRLVLFTRGTKIHMNSVFRILWSVCVWICVQFVCCSIYHKYIYMPFFFPLKLYIFLAILEFTMLTSLTSNSEKSAFFCFPRARIKSVWYHAGLIYFYFIYLFVWIYVCALHSCNLRRLEDSFRCPGRGIAESCGLMCILGTKS